MKKNHLIFSSLLFMSVLQAAEASVSYTYTGQNFNYFNTSNGLFQPFTTANHVVFEFTTASALGANATIQTASNTPVPQITSWSFTDGTHTVTSNQEQAFQLFNLTTDAQGDINWWSISLMPATAANGYFMGTIVNPWGTGFGGGPLAHDYVSASNGALSSTAYAQAETTLVGNWQNSLTAVPVPGSVWLFSSGMSLLLALKSRRAKSK